ncbi:MAG TPA: hypothetical protein VK907_03985 [Phnomibacter sp.]|nr:hypothetical protein [Phnomibacter sp.]
MLTQKILAVTYIAFSAMAITSGTAQPIVQKDQELVARADGLLLQAADQYKILRAALPDGKFPKTYFPTTGQHQFSGSEWWCSGFYPGTLLMLYRQTQQAWLKQEAERMLGLLEKEQHNITTHDLGFMMYNSFGLANEQWPSDHYRQVLITSARSLATRFSPVTGCIRSWDSGKDDFLVIIDNMMNLELLFRAAEYTGDSSFYHIAVTHANTTLRHHFRPDFSSYHVLNYDPHTGKIKLKRTEQGFANESAWARGQAWGLYGYISAYRYTKDPAYLQQATGIADFLLNHPNMPPDKIPYWDFNATGIPNALRDASAGCIMASALLELCQYVPAEKAALYLSDATTMLRTLSSSEYFASPGSNGGFLIQHGVGHLPQKSEVDVPLTYGDYYFIEALIRYKDL